MATITDAAIGAIAQKFAGIREFQETKRGLIGRRNEMHVTQIAIVMRGHVLLYGVPGVAKSMTVDGMLMHMPDLDQFKTQAYKASPPEQFLGPISIKQMAEDRFVRIVKGRAPRAHVFFCDEVARAPRALLPAFQGMMVEREFDAGAGIESVPLMSFIGTANHIPDDPELEAFFDRFTLKLIVRPPSSQQQFVDILKGALSRRETGEPAIPDDLILTFDEIATFQRAVETVHIPEAILESYAELWSNLLGEGIMPSIRRYVDGTKAMQACARLAGRDEVIVDDMQIAQHILWSHPDQQPAVYGHVVQFASEWVKTKAELLDSFAETLDRLGQVQALVAGGADTTSHATIEDEDRSITDHGIKVVSAQKKLRRLIEKHIADASGQDTGELEAALTQMDAGRAWVTERLLGGLDI